MAIFRYKAVAPGGEVIEGTMEALSRDEVVNKLQEAGNLPLDASESTGAATASFASMFARSDMSAQQIELFTQQLGTLLGAGQPLDRALQILLELPDDERARKVLDRVREAVRGGTSLSSAMEQQHGVFSRLYINMVRAGEVSGSLTDTLKRLAEYLTRSREMRNNVIGALIYPAILVFMVVLAIGALMIFVIPKFEEVFAGLGTDLPLVTRAVLGLGRFAENWWWLVVLGCFAFVFWMRSQLSNPDSRRVWDERFLNVRGFGPLMQKVETARVARTLGTLVHNGVPLLTALSIARNVAGNMIISEALDAVAEDVKTGGSLAYSMAKTKRFPKLAVQMVGVGEESGELDNMLTRTADTMDSEVAFTTSRLIAAMVPILTVIMTIVVACVMMAIILPLLDLTSAVG